MAELHVAHLVAGEVSGHLAHQKHRFILDLILGVGCGEEHLNDSFDGRERERTIFEAVDQVVDRGEYQT